MINTIKKIDFTLQTIFICITLFGWIFNEEYGFYGMWALGITQTCSIIYHSIILRTNDSKLRNGHYYSTVIILFTLLLLYILANADINIDNFVLELLIFITAISFILCIIYYIITCQTFSNIFSKKNHTPPQ